MVGGTLTNFDTIRLRLKRLEELEGLEKTGAINRLAKSDFSQSGTQKDTYKLGKAFVI